MTLLHIARRFMIPVMHGSHLLTSEYILLPNYFDFYFINNQPAIGILQIVNTIYVLPLFSQLFCS